MSSQQRSQQLIGLFEFVNRSFGHKECCRCQQNHGTVDAPANAHGQQGVGKFKAQLLPDDFLIFAVPLPALDYFRM